MVTKSVKAQQFTSMRVPGAQQARTLQAATIPAQVNGGLGIDMGEIMGLMITMMIVVMMMKMMTGAMGSIS